jgi:uncharacterized hydrophobic protein (TIGR00271 family)
MFRLIKLLFSDIFILSDEQEAHDQITDTIVKGVTFTGTNLWVLIFAVFVASVGLNVNSTAVIIGAMLISPLMGPIMGMGLGAGTYDRELLIKSLKNLGFAIFFSLLTSTGYFLISPLNQAHSELLARTSPNIYDVLIAFFGGLAGIIAITSKQKGNALQGAAIATALMPPLCTAGYGIATAQWSFFFGAFYLFIINSVFIGLATYFTVRLLNFPTKDVSSQIIFKRVVAFVVFITIIPSIYLGYKLTEEERFIIRAGNFIANECNFTNSYILKQEINPQTKTLRLIIGGKDLPTDSIEVLRKNLVRYHIGEAQLIIENKLSLRSETPLTSSPEAGRNAYLNALLTQKQLEINNLQSKLDSVRQQSSEMEKLVREVRIQYPAIKDFNIWQYKPDSTGKKRYTATIQVENEKKLDMERLYKWLSVRLETERIDFYTRNGQ